MKASSDLVDRGLIFALVVALYVIVMQLYPIIYGGDTILRLANFPRVLIGYQLPLFQIMVHFAMKWFYGPLAIWLLMGVISGSSGAGLYALTRQITRERSAAWVAGLLYATHPFVLFYARVPYQEPLLLAGIVWGFFFLFQPESWRTLALASLFFGIACLTRYEGWIATAVAALFRLWQVRARESRITLPATAQSLALFGWAPILWILWNGGLSPEGTYVLDARFDWARLYRPYFIVKTILWWTGPGALLMILAGLAWTWIDPRLRKDRRLHALILFSVLFLLGLIFSGHGIKPDPARFVTEREAYTLTGLLMLWAGIGGSRLSLAFQKATSGAPALGRAVPIVGFLLVAAYDLNSGIQHVARANEDPVLMTDYRVARFLAARQSTAMVLAQPLPEEEIEQHLRRAERASGPEGRARAQQLLSEVELTPLDYQRVLVYSWMGKTKILSGDQLQGFDRAGVEGFLRARGVRYVALFSDFTPMRADERALLSLCCDGRAPIAEIQHGEKQARIYSLD